MLDLVLLLLIAVGSVAIGSQLVSREKVWLILPAGFVAITVLRVATYVISIPFERLFEPLRGINYWVFMAAVIGFSIRAVPKLKEHAIALGASLALMAVTLFSVKVLGFLTLGHGDSIWIMTESEWVAKGGDPWVMGTQMSLKRGFALILLLGLGKAGERMDVFMPLIYGMLMILILGLALNALKGYSRRVITWSLVLVALAVYTAWLPWATVYYMNGHTLVAIGVLVASSALLLDESSFKSEFARVLVFNSGIAIIAVTRPEGVVLALVMVALFAARGYKSSKEVVISVSVAFASFLAWMAVVNSYLVPGIKVVYLAVGMAIAVGVLAYLYKKFPTFVNRVFALTPVILVSIIVLVEIFLASYVARGNLGLFNNLLLGAGRWGFLVWGFLAIAIASRFVERDKTYSLVMRILFSLALATLISKLFDGGRTGLPSLGRTGWVDSVNRMWIHFVGLFVLALILGLAQVFANKYVPMKPPAFLAKLTKSKNAKTK